MSEINGFNLGLTGSSFNASALIEKTMQKQQKLIEPSKIRLEKTQLKLDTWTQAKGLIDEVRTAANPLIPLSAWNKKLVNVSNEDILTATVGSAAEPGTHYITVEQVALSHMLGSQTYDTEDSYIGTGELKIKVDDGDYKIIKIDKTQNTIKGMVDAINNAGIDVKAQIIKTDHKDNNFRVVLTSLVSGEDGYIHVITDFEYENAPNFDNFYSQPSEWKFAPSEISEETADDKGASSSVPVFSGRYSGDDDITLTFTAMNTGKVGGDNTLSLTWEDDQGRSGILDLGKFAYSPDTPIEVVDGIMVSFTDGDIVINDTFQVSAKPDETGSWWLSEEEEAPEIFKPTVWSRQYDEGKPQITGKFTGDDDDEYTLRVVKGGIIGVSEQVLVEYESDNGFSGTLNIGRGYKPGDKLALGQGLELSLKKGTLHEGFESKFEVEEGVSGDYWWLFPDGENEDIPGEISKSLDWYGFEGDQVDFSTEDLINPETGKSNAAKSVTGRYEGMENKIYTFTVEGNGTVGVTKGIYLNWEDDKGNKGTLNVGDSYGPGSEIPFDSGLNLILEKGQIFNEDSFTVDAFSATIQPAQDALIRLGADPGDGGLQIRNNTNEFKEAIRGVAINVHQASEEAVILTIEDDRENIKEMVQSLIEKYNAALDFFQESLKYDISTQIAGPLQADSTLSGIQRKFREMIITPISGLPQGENTLSSAGITIDKLGRVEFNEEVFANLFNENYEHVANLFRNHGQSDNSGIVFLSASAATKSSRNEGYQLDITQAATSGYYESSVVEGDIVIDKSNRDFKAVIDGKESGKITLDEGSYSLKQFTRDLEKKLKSDENVKNVDFSVLAEGGRLVIRSNNFGTSSSVEFEGIGQNLLSTSNPVLDGESVEGKNVEATLDGIKLNGQGRVLRGEKDSDFEGLRLFSLLTEGQVNDGSEARLRVTKGLGQRLKSYLDEILLPSKGMVDNSAQGVKDEISNINDNIKRFEERMTKKKQDMIRQFSTMESKISELKSQQTYLQGQFPTG